MMPSFASPRRFGLLAAGVLLGLFALGACKAEQSVVTIKTLLDDPTRYDGQVVRIAGDVGTAVGAFGFGAYQVNDGTGTLNVVSKTGGARHAWRVQLRDRRRVLPSDLGQGQSRSGG